MLILLQEGVEFVQSGRCNFRTFIAEFGAQIGVRERYFYFCCRPSTMHFEVAGGATTPNQFDRASCVHKCMADTPKGAAPELDNHCISVGAHPFSWTASAAAPWPMVSEQASSNHKDARHRPGGRMASFAEFVNR